VHAMGSGGSKAATAAGGAAKRLLPKPGEAFSPADAAAAVAAARSSADAAAPDTNFFRLERKNDGSLGRPSLAPVVAETAAGAYTRPR